MASSTLTYSKLNGLSRDRRLPTVGTGVVSTSSRLRESQPHMTRAFKAQLGTTPAAYRRRTRG